MTRQRNPRSPADPGLGAILDAPAPADAGMLRQLAEVAGEVVVAVGVDRTRDGGCASSSPHARTATAVRTIAEAARRLPPSVGAVLVVDVEGMPMLSPAYVERLITALGDEFAAVVSGAAVTDALKQVEQGRLIGSVSREGLVSAATPLLIRRPALDAVAATLPSATTRDVIDRLVATGSRVRVIGQVADAGPVSVA